MSYLGTTYCKFISGANEVELPHSLLDPTFNAPEIILTKSPLTGKKTVVRVNDYSELKVLIHLLKYDDPEGFLEDLHSYKGAAVVFYPFVNGSAMKGLDGENALFFVKNIESFFLNDTLQEDVCVITFSAINYVSMYPTGEGGYGIFYGNRYLE